MEIPGKILILIRGLELDCDRPFPLLDEKYGKYSDEVLIDRTGHYCNNGTDFLDEYFAWEEGDYDWEV